MKYIGIDGCKAGWLLTGLDEQGRLGLVLLSSIGELSRYLENTECILIDIPIGLRTRHTEERTCDSQARKLLSPHRGSSVFPVPSRCALNCHNYREALARNRECTGRGITKQTFNIMPKIREVDSYLQKLDKRKIIHEMHPEVCFWALNDQRPMQTKKREQDGFEERLAILNQFIPDAGVFIEQVMQQTLRKQVARDDIVDALVGVVTASHANQLQSIPEHPELDETGLPMEIVYAIP